MAEMPQPSYNVTVVDDAHPNGIPLEQWQNKPVQKPVAWSGYDLDGMVEAFSRVIEAHHSSKHPFHNPIDMDAKMALRILRGFIPSMKAYAATPQRPAEPVQEPVAWRCACGANLYIDADGAPRSKAEPVEPVAVSVDALAQHIRFVDGNNNLGAGILAEKIVEFLIKLGIGKEQAEPVQKPFGYLWPTGMHPEFRFTQQKRDGVDGMPLYTAPPQRLPLTEQEIDAATAQERDALLDHIYEYGTAAEGVLERIRKLCRAVERAYGIVACGNIKE